MVNAALFTQLDTNAKLANHIAGLCKRRCRGCAWPDVGWHCWQGTSACLPNCTNTMQLRRTRELSDNGFARLRWPESSARTKPNSLKQVHNHKQDLARPYSSQACRDARCSIKNKLWWVKASNYSQLSMLRFQLSVQPPDRQPCHVHMHCTALVTHQHTAHLTQPNVSALPS